MMKTYTQFKCLLDVLQTATATATCNSKLQILHGELVPRTIHLNQGKTTNRSISQNIGIGKGRADTCTLYLTELPPDLSAQAG